MEEPKKMDLRSMDITEEHKARLKELFPHVFNEDKIDFERLRQTLGEDIDTGLERFGLTWPGKSECMKIIQQPSIGTLKPCKEESVNFDTTENLFIEGDNLEVLKLLQKSYYGKAKMICIDPPYNTGKEFIYPDKYSESLETYLAYTGQVDAEGKKFSTNTETDGRFHSKWLNMMYPRLYLARNLLRDDGVIFINIDDNEVSSLRKMCDEVFGEENFVESIVWKRRATPPNDRIIGKNHEYVLVYTKNIELVALYLQPRDEKSKQRYSNPDNDPKGPWVASDLSANGKGDRLVESCIFPIKNPNNQKEYLPPENKCWLYNKVKISQFIAENRIGFRTQTGTPFLKRYLSEVRDGITLPTIIDDGGFSQDSAKEIKELFNRDIFEFPKPTIFLKKLINCGLSNNDTILDFFAGSATTAHAVLDLNKQDGGNRKFIMVQLPEPCAEDSEAFKAGYKTIADIGKERIRRVIKKIQSESKGQLDFQGSKMDLGFKVFKLDQSNFKIWDGAVDKTADGEKIQKQLELQIEHINPNATEDDILYELLLKSGYTLTTQVESLQLAGKKVYSIENGDLLICLEKKLTKEVITEMARKEPARVICLDTGFSGNDQLKTNAVQIMKSHKVEDFRTV